MSYDPVREELGQVSLNAFYDSEMSSARANRSYLLNDHRVLSLLQNLVLRSSKERQTCSRCGKDISE